MINGHEYVDLGLPSGTKWATCNIGATTPEGLGEYFAWGETKPKSKYTEDNCPTYQKDDTWLRKNGYIDASGNLTMSHDAARQYWGGTWRMPTKAEIEELIKNTTTKWIMRNGVSGKLVTSKRNGKSIFLPAAGSKFGEENQIYCVGLYSDNWGSTSLCDSEYSSACLESQSDKLPSDMVERFYSTHTHRRNGCSIRPVTD